jgi:hypothetical protein
MSNQIILKKSSVGNKVPLATDLAYGELALNYADGLLYFKNSNATISSFTSDTSSFATLTGTQTLTNKTLTSPTLTNATASGSLTVSGQLKDKNNSAGLTGQYLVSTNTGVQWVTLNTGALSNLTDVNLSAPKTQQVLTYNGTQWVNADSNAVVASAVFASSQYDMGQITDAVITVSEDEGLVTGVANNIYDLGVLSFTGIISLNNIDQSVKSDYLGYSIIFGF